MWIPTENDRPVRTAMGNQRGLWMTTLSGSHLERTDRRRCGRSFFAPAHLLETLESTRNDSSAPREHGGDPRGSRCWPRRSLPTHRSTLASRGTDGERATRGAIGACSVGHRGESGRTRSFGDDERCDTRDGRGCTQRTAHGEGPRILSPGNESGERRRSAKAKNTPLSTLHRSLLQK